jgi:hypothetical protein
VYNQVESEVPMNNGDKAARAIEATRNLFMAVGVTVSFAINKSVFWAPLHGSIAPIYLIYYWLGYAGQF